MKKKITIMVILLIVLTLPKLLKKLFTQERYEMRLPSMMDNEGGRLQLVRVWDESEVEEVALGEYQVKKTGKLVSSNP